MKSSVLCLFHYDLADFVCSSHLLTGYGSHYNHHFLTKSIKLTIETLLHSMTVFLQMVLSLSFVLVGRFQSLIINGTALLCFFPFGSYFLLGL